MVISRLRPNIFLHKNSQRGWHLGWTDATSAASSGQLCWPSTTPVLSWPYGQAQSPAATRRYQQGTPSPAMAWHEPPAHPGTVGTDLQSHLEPDAELLAFRSDDAKLHSGCRMLELEHRGEVVRAKGEDAVESGVVSLVDRPTLLIWVDFDGRR